MDRMQRSQDNEVTILECLEKLQDKITELRNQILHLETKKPLDFNAIDDIFQDIYATGWPGPKLSDEDIKFVRAIEAAHGIYSEEQN